MSRNSIFHTAKHVISGLSSLFNVQDQCKVTEIHLTLLKFKKIEQII